MKIAVAGCMGRMGREVLKLLIHEHKRNHCDLVGGIVNTHSEQDLGLIAGLEAFGINSSSDAESIIQNADLLIDFTSSVASIKFAKLCAKHGKKMVCGITGFTLEQHKELEELAKLTPIFYAPNMSIGINLLVGLAEKAAKTLDESFDIEIIEAHHNKKKDAPSGAALRLGAAMQNARGKKDMQMCTDRNKVRVPGEIGYAVIRGGDIVGDHTVMFAGIGERIELTHRASDRKIFARGAVNAAFWLKDKTKGKLYSMQDLLG